jgi:hypothetical protein
LLAAALLLRGTFLLTLLRPLRVALEVLALFGLRVLLLRAPISLRWPSRR